MLTVVIMLTIDMYNVDNCHNVEERVKLIEIETIDGVRRATAFFANNSTKVLEVDERKFYRESEKNSCINILRNPLLNIADDVYDVKHYRKLGK